MPFDYGNAITTQIFYFFMLTEIHTTQYDTDLEQVVLGAILLESDCLHHVISDLKPELFHDSKHAVICKTIIELHGQNEEVDILTVTMRIKAKKVSEDITPSFVANLTTRVASSANVPAHIKILQQLFLKRSAKAIGEKIVRMSVQPDVDCFELISKSIETLEKVESGVINKSFDTIASLKDDFIKELEARRSGAISSGINYGLKAIDKEIGGANKTDLIILAARPGMGKTAFALKIARNCAIQLNKPCGFFSLEMSSEQLLLRIASAEAIVDSAKFRSGDLSHAEINSVSEHLNRVSKAPLFIDDTGGLNINEFRNRARKMVRENGVEMIIADYLQLFTSSEHKNDRNNQVSHISATLKATAKELNIPIIALSQLSREVEKRPDKRPKLSDLRDSGSIEQDADQVVFLYRPEYYEVNEIEIDGINVSSEGKALVEFAKNRHGKLTTEVVAFSGAYTEFGDLTSGYYQNLQPIENSF